MFPPMSPSESPAFPIKTEGMAFSPGITALGLSHRAYIATACMQGFLANSEHDLSPDAMASWAVLYADALLAELAK